MSRKFEDLRSSEISSLDRDKSVFLFTVGGMQDFGPHLPVGLNLKKARYLSKKWAESLEVRQNDHEVIFMPAAPLCIQSVTQRFAPNIRGFVLRDYLIDSCRHLGRLGFKHFYCLSGDQSPKQLTAIEEASMTLEKPWSFIYGVKKKKAP